MESISQTEVCRCKASPTAGLHSEGLATYAIAGLVNEDFYHGSGLTRC